MDYDPITFAVIREPQSDELSVCRVTDSKEEFREMVSERVKIKTFITSDGSNPKTHQVLQSLMEYRDDTEDNLESILTKLVCAAFHEGRKFDS